MISFFKTALAHLIFAVHHLYYGIHSKIPFCCVKFYVKENLLYPDEPTAYAAHQRRKEVARDIDTLNEYKRAHARYQYVACPDCSFYLIQGKLPDTDKGHGVGNTHDCTHECQNKWTHKLVHKLFPLGWARKTRPQRIIATVESNWQSK